MNVSITAKAIKALLVQMASNNTLPTDMNDLPLDGIEAILEGDKAARIKKASMFLRGRDNNHVENMIRLIEECKNENLFIDDIIGVWESPQYHFTVKQFLQEIE